MARSTPPCSRQPDWDRLYELASAQAGHFTTAQASEAGYSGPLLHKHILAGRMRRVRRGVLRLVHFPPTEHEELVAPWLWSEQAGVFSHQTALALHELSDLLPAQLHLTLPRNWQSRRLRVPEGLVLHFADVPRRRRGWAGPVPITDPLRTLEDCALAGLSPELLRQAVRQALARGWVQRRELSKVAAALRSFGGLRG